MVKNLFFSRSGLSTGNHGAILGTINHGQVLWGNVKISLAYQRFGRRVAKTFGELPINRQKVALFILQPDIEGEIVEQGALVAAVLAQCLFGFPAFADVAID